MIEPAQHEQTIHPPRAPIDRLVDPLTRFLHIEMAGGLVLIAATVAALALANSPVSDKFLQFWKTPVGLQVGSFEFRHSLKHLINDGLMVIFFFVIGMEVKRELVLGELRDVRRAALPIVAALGGMVVPAGVYLMLRAGKEGAHGWGIPMATDIAFVVGCMAILGRRVPHPLRIMLLTLAIADDIGAILVIALGYTSGLNLGWLLLAVGGLGFVLVLARLGVRNLLVYTLCGVFIWFATHESGIHATLAGVALGLMTPARSYLSASLGDGTLERARDRLSGDEWAADTRKVETLRKFHWATREMVSPLDLLMNILHPWVSFVIMPLFALANAGVAVRVSEFTSPVAIATALGLLIGKPVGIVLFSYFAVTARIAKLGDNVTWVHMVAAGALAGIGFTMALFIANLALTGELLDDAKVGVLAGSLLSAVLGMILLRLAPLSRAPEDPAASQLSH